jgi:hypothetical protein
MGSSLVDIRLYWWLVGNLLYLTHIRLDLVHVISLVSWYMQALEESHMARPWSPFWIIYIITYWWVSTLLRREESNLLNLLDTHFTHDHDDQVSTGAYIFVLSTTPILWSSKKQTTITCFSYDIEYHALSNCTCDHLVLESTDKDRFALVVPWFFIVITKVQSNY